MINSMNIGWWVKRWSDLHPDKTAVCFERSLISYSELHGRADRTACWLQSFGIRKGDRVAVMMKNCPEFIELYLACARLGVIFVPVNFRLTARELTHIVGNAEPRMFVFDAEYADIVQRLQLDPGVEPPLCAFLGKGVSNRGMMDYTEGLCKFSGQTPLLTDAMGPADPEEPQVIMYTSGTTGLAKGAVLSYRKTFFNSLNADIFFDLGFDDIMLIILPLFHSGGLFIQASPILYKGGTLVIHSRFDPDLTYQDIAGRRVTKFLGVPTVYRTLIARQIDQQRDRPLRLPLQGAVSAKAPPTFGNECQGLLIFPFQDKVPDPFEKRLFFEREGIHAEFRFQQPSGILCGLLDKVSCWFIHSCCTVLRFLSFGVSDFAPPEIPPTL